MRQRSIGQGGGGRLACVTFDHGWQIEAGSVMTIWGRGAYTPQRGRAEARGHATVKACLVETGT